MLQTESLPTLLVCRIELRHCEGKLKYVVRKPFTCSDDFFLSKKTSLQKWIRSNSTPMIPVDTFITSKLDPPPSRILLSNPKGHWFKDQTLLSPLSVSNPKLQQASSNACSCSSRSNLVEILSETDLFRNPNGGHKSLLRPEFVKSFCRMWFDGWALRRVQSAAPKKIWKKKQLPRICNDTR